MKITKKLKDKPFIPIEFNIEFETEHEWCSFKKALSFVLDKWNHNEYNTSEEWDVIDEIYDELEGWDGR